MAGKKVNEAVPDLDKKLLEPGAIMSLAFATECEGMRIAMSIRNGAGRVADLVKAIEETDNTEPRLALGWLKRWEDADA
jgi:type IV secretory pathway ATPase VirB11/archaellum biosynthesis ATPase